MTTVSASILSDYTRNRPVVMSLATLAGFITASLLAIWTIPAALKWFAFFASRASSAYGALAMSWANEICGGDAAEERAVILGIMNAAGFAVNAWLPFLTYPAVDAPTFHKGFRYSVGAFAAQGGVTWMVWWLARRERDQKEITLAREEDDGAA